MSAAPLPEQRPAECLYGHPFTHETTGWSERIGPVCLTCLGFANEAYLKSDYISGRLLAVLLMPPGLVPMPSREEVYGK